MKHLLLPAAGAVLIAASADAFQPGGSVSPPPAAKIFLTTSPFLGDSALVAMERASPWLAVTVAPLDSADAVVQTFGGLIYVVEPETDRVRVFDGAGSEIRSFTVGAGTAPRDILGLARNRAYVTRAGSTHLYRVDPQTGAGSDVVDLGVLAGPDGIPDMERMATDGSRLFVQLRRFEDGVPTSDGAVAVVDLETESLIDANPATPEIDAIELLGPAPRFRMHVDVAGGYMLVSATDGHHLNVNGGIEQVDLGTLTSNGFVLAEAELAALGGFVMTGPGAGYFLFHTDIIPSNHLQTFTVDAGADPGPEIVFDAGIYLDALLFDPGTGLLFMPAASGGLHVVDTTTGTPVTTEPVPLPGPPVDQVIGPVGHRYDLTGDGLVDVDDLVTLLQSWGECPSPCPPTCVADIAAKGVPGADCTVDVDDLLLLLLNWGPTRLGT
ncbi:MAG: YncE family protein [Planctomycetota bacterium]|jgi:hypothetical protein